MTRITLPLIAIALLIAGCTKSETPQPEPTTPTVHGSLAECLHANGVPKSAGPAVVLGRPDGVDEATWDKAMKACSTMGPGPAS